MALCPSEPLLDHARRFTGYICRGRVTVDTLEEVPPSDATAVTFFRITATAMQTQLLAARAVEPTACCGGSAMVVWRRLSDISFDDLAAPEGLRRGLNAHLQALRASRLLRALEQCMAKYSEGLAQGSKNHQKRRRLNEDLRQLLCAIDHIEAPAGNALGQSPAPMQPLASTAVDVTPFHDALAASHARPQVAPLRPADLVGAELAVSLARVAMQVAAKAGEAIRGGRAICPRTGLLLPPPRNQTQPGCPKTSKVLLDVIGKEMPTGWAKAFRLSKGKHCGVWIAPLRDVRAATGSVFSLGEVSQLVHVDAG